MKHQVAPPGPFHPVSQSKTWEGELAQSLSAMPLQGHRRTPGLGGAPTPRVRQTLIRKTRSHCQKSKAGAFCPVNQEQKIVSVLGKRNASYVSEGHRATFKLRSTFPIQLLKQKSTRINTCNVGSFFCVSSLVVLLHRLNK